MVAAVLVVLVKPFAVHFYLEHLPSSSTAIWQLEVACELLKPVRPPSLLPRSRMRHEGTDQDVGDPALIGLGCFVAPKAPLVTKQFLAWLAAPVDGDPLMDPSARDRAVRDYRSHLQAVAKAAPATVNGALAAIDDF